MLPLLDFHYSGSRAQALSTLLRLYPSYSFKRTLLKWLNAINQIGPRILPCDLSPTKVDSLLPTLPKEFNRAYLLHKLNQNGRLYVFDQSDNGNLACITKLALNEKAAHGIRREYAALNLLSGRTLFNIPKILSFESWDGGCALSITAVPHGQLVHNKQHRLPDAIFDAVAILRPTTLPTRLPANEIEGWQSAANYATCSEICRVAMNINPGMLFAVCAAHRDLGSENIFSEHPAETLSDFTLIDWEFFTETAPALTDRVGAWLGARHQLLKGWRRANVNSASQFLSDFSDAPDAAVIALLHLAEMGIDLARILTGDTREAA